MELVLASLHLSWMGGATTYLLTVAPVLQRLGHQVTLYSPDPGDTAERARTQGLRVVVREGDLPERCDGVLVQDTVLALELADRLRAPQVFVSHGAGTDLAVPPQVGEQTVTVVAMSDPVAQRARALALDVEIVRLRQPIDTQRFWARGPLRDPPEEVLLLGNYLAGERRSMIIEACDALGLRCHQVGRSAEMATDVTDAIARADIVVGYGRSILEAMASGRAAYVFDWMGGDGWVTADNYAALERGGFAGGPARTQLNASLVREALSAFDPRMGVANRQLILSHHSALAHGVALAELFQKAGGRSARPPDHGRELARVVRSQWHADWRAEELWRELESVGADRLEQERRAVAAEARALAAEQRFSDLAATRRWRMLGRLLAPIDRLRGR